jgi:hypothetical protein
MLKKVSSFTKKQAKEYEEIESKMQKIIKYADKHCRKVRRGPVPFSPVQKKLMGAVVILNQMKLRLLLTGKKNRPRTKRIQRLIKKYAYDGQTKFNNIADVTNEINIALKKYNDFKPKAHEQRWTYLETIAREHHARDGKGVQHHYKTLLHREQVKDYFRRIKYSEGRQSGGSVEKIQMNINGTEQVVYDKQTIEQEIMRVNKIKLQQANHTPLRSERLAVLLGEQGDFERWEQVLLGMINLPDDADDSLKLWYNYITQADKHSNTDITWSTKEYFESWKKINEEKTTLPGIQVAHIKCINPDSKAAEVISLLALLPLTVGYSPRTWRKGIDSMIPKKTADLRPENYV